MPPLCLLLLLHSCSSSSSYAQAIRDRLVNGLRVGVALALVGVFGALFGTFGPCITAKDAADRFALIS